MSWKAFIDSWYMCLERLLTLPVEEVPPEGSDSRLSMSTSCGRNHVSCLAGGCLGTVLYDV